MLSVVGADDVAAVAVGEADVAEVVYPEGVAELSLCCCAGSSLFALDLDATTPPATAPMTITKTINPMIKKSKGSPSTLRLFPFFYTDVLDSSASATGRVAPFSDFSAPGLAYGSNFENLL